MLLDRRRAGCPQAAAPSSYKAPICVTCCRVVLFLLDGRWPVILFVAHHAELRSAGCLSVADAARQVGVHIIIVCSSCASPSILRTCCIERTGACNTCYLSRAFEWPERALAWRWPSQRASSGWRG